MTVTALAIRVIARSDRGRRPNEAVLLVVCAAVDAVAAGILLFGTPLPLSLEALAAAVAHGTAVLVMSGLARARPSRRWLCVAAVLAVPFVGAAVATAIFFARGDGSTAKRRRRETRRRAALTMAGVKRLGAALSLCDALDGGDEEQRRAALSVLSQREDPEAIALLLRAARGRDPDLALSAALVLDEIGERAERKVDLPEPAEVRNAAG